MELRHLRYFVAVAETNNFTIAAERLHTAQPSLSRQIRDLEDHIGTPLFTRTSRRVNLTAAGQIFLEESKLLLLQAERAVQRTREAGQLHLTLGFVPGVEREPLITIMELLNGELQHIKLSMHSQSSPKLITALKERSLDAAFIRPSEETQELALSSIRHERLILALPTKHPLASRKCIAISELAGEKLINVTSEGAPVLYKTIQDYAADHSVVLKWAYEAEGQPLGLSLISEFGAMGIVPEYVKNLLPKEITWVELENAPTIELALAWHPKNDSKALAQFLDAFLKQALS